jgi:hypothetical protein
MAFLQAEDLAVFIVNTLLAMGFVVVTYKLIEGERNV